ncbi:MAG: hypothetical protein ACO3E2_05470, partial [Burkholderiaceae bacterium]
MSLSPFPTLSLLPLMTASLLLLGCAAIPTDPRPDKPHHTPTGFQNLPGGGDKPGFKGFLKWQWERLGRELTPQDASKVPRVALEPSALEVKSPGWTMTWLGHASVHLQIDGLAILIDPVFSGRASPFESIGPRAHNAPPITPQNLP